MKTFLLIDDFEIADGSDIIKTTLGSCVSVALFAREHNLFGMNHFMSSKTGMELNQSLLHTMRKMGGRNLTAMFFGGSEKWPLAQGRLNQQLALKFLEDNSIPIEGYHVGGDTGITVELSLESVRVTEVPILQWDTALIKKGT